MSHPALLHRLLGRDLNSLLWRALLLCAVLEFVLPGTREMASVVLNPQRTVHLVTQQDSDAGELDRVAARLNQAWAWVAVAERAAEEKRAAYYERAVALAPDDEVVLVRRAVGLSFSTRRNAAGNAIPAATGISVASSPLAPAAAEAARLAPDNAVGWYLLAASKVRAGDRDAALSALRRGNRAPRCDDHTREALSYAARLAQARGVASFESWLTCMAASVFPHLAAYREVARELVNGGATLPQRLEVAAMGARLRDGSASLISTLVGIAVEQIAFAGPTDPKAKTPPNQTKEQQAAHRREQTLAFAKLLRDSGQSTAATWVEGELKRNEAARASMAQAAHLTVLQRELDPHLAAYGAWALWMAMAVLAAFVLLLWAAGCRRPRSGDGMAWRARDLITVWCATVVPFVLLAGALAQAAATQSFAHLFAAAPADVRSAHTLLTSLLATVPLPLFCSLGLLRVVTRAYQRRHLDATSLDCASFARASTRALLVPTAGLLLLLAWAAQGPCVTHRHAVANQLATYGFNETSGMIQAMDAAAPARPLPR